MLTVYAAALAVGGSLLLASLLLGHHGADHDVGDTFDVHGHPESPGELGLAMTVLSFRFWTFAAAFFGLTGVLFEKLELASGRTTLGLAIAMGVGIGFGVSWTINRLRTNVVNSLPSEVGYAGLVGEMLLEASGDESGRIRISARGSLIDLPARSQNKERLAKGSRALVVDVTDGVACVAAAPESGGARAPENGSQTS